MYNIPLREQAMASSRSTTIFNPKIDHDTATVIKIDYTETIVNKNHLSSRMVRP